MTNSLFKAIELLSSREGYFLSLIKAKIFKDVEKISDGMFLSQLIIEHKNGTWGEDYLEDGVEVKVLRSPDIRHGFIDSKNAEQRFILKNDYYKHKLIFGDILVIKSSGSQDLVGKSQLFDVDEDGIIPSNFVLRLRPNLEKVDPYYLDLFLKSPQSLNWRFENQTTTTGLRNLKTKEYLETLVPIPPVEVQKYIVNFYQQCIKGVFEKNSIFACDEYEKIYNLVNELELLNKNTTRQSEIVQKFRECILQDAIQGKLVLQDENDEPASVLLERIKQEKEQLLKEKRVKKEKSLPQTTDEEKPFELSQGWAWTAIDNIGFTVTGKTPPTSNQSYYEGDIPFLNPANIVNGKVSYEGKRISEEGAKYSQVIPENSILIVCINGSLENGIGRAGKTTRSVAFNQQINAIVPNKNLNSDYLLLAVRSPFFQKQIKEKATGTVNYIINKNAVRALSLPLPPLNEQKRIVEKVNQLMTLCSELETNIERSKQEAETLMKAVLQEVFTVKEEVLS